MSGLSTLGDVYSALSQEFASELARQFNYQAVTATLFETVPGNVDGSGKNVAWDVNVGGVTASSYAEGTNMADSEFTNSTSLPATLPWGHYRSGFWMSQTAIDAAMNSKGSKGLLDLFRVQVMDHGSKLASLANFDIINGTGVDVNSNPTIVGLLGGALDPGGLYANINRSTYPLFGGNVLGNGGVARALTADLMAQADQLIFTACGEPYSGILMSPGAFRKYEGLFTPGARFMSEGAVGSFDISTSDFFYKGKPVFRDKDIPETNGKGTAIFFNKNYVKKLALPSSPASSYPGDMTEELTGSSGQAKTPTGLPFEIMELSRNGDAVRILVKLVAQLRVMRPNSCCVISDIAV